MLTLLTWANSHTTLRCGSPSRPDFPIFMEKFLVFETYHDVSATDHDRLLHTQYLIFDYIILLMHAESTLKSYTSCWMTPFFLLLVYWVYRNAIQARVRWSSLEYQCHLCPTWPPLAANPGNILSNWIGNNFIHVWKGEIGCPE